MKMMNKKIVILLVCVLLASVLLSGCVGNDDNTESGISKKTYKEITDSRGKEIKVPSEINKVVTISDGLVESVMIAIGVEEKIVGVGSSCIQRDFTYTFEQVNGPASVYKKGFTTATALYPKLTELPLIGASGSAINYETVAELDPDVIIARVGSCTLRHKDDENTIKTIQTLETLGVPVVVLYGSNCFDDPDMTKISDEIRIIGSIFGKEQETNRIANYLEQQIEMIIARTKDIKEEDKPRALIFGASPSARKKGGAGQVFGLDTIESYFIENVSNAKNAFNEDGYFKVVSAEQLLTIDPDIIVLCTANGYHPPEELYNAPYYQNIKELKAIKNKRVSSLPWSPCNCAKRVEYPIDAIIIAKSIYPEKFRDIDLGDYLLNFYKNVYEVDHETALKLRSAQWMDWVLDDYCSVCN